MDKSPDMWNTILTKEKSESMIKIRRQPPKIYSHSIACLSDLSLINAWPWEVLPCKNTRFFGGIAWRGRPPAQIVLDFFTGTNFEHKFIVFVYVVSTLSFDHISTYDKCNFLILFVMTWIEALRSNYVFFLPPLPGQCQKENICFREVVP